jgi:hypothetical protein
MLIELPPEQRESIRPLFAGVPGLRGCVDALFDGGMGRTWADDAAQPQVAVAVFDFYFLAGDANAPAAEEAAGAVDRDASIVTTGRQWELLLRGVWGERLRTRTRVEFSDAPAWGRERLRGFIDALPAGFELKRIERSDAARFTELADSLTYNFDSLDDFIERGVGFGVEHEGRFVSGCSSFAISSHSLEFEIQTHADFRQRGLASATAAAMILQCLDSGLEPCWDAHNEISAALATKLGFVDPKPYTAYELRD